MFKENTRTINLNTVINATGIAKGTVERARKRLEDFNNDSRKEHRLRNHWCKVCCYLTGHIGGQAITASTCSICKKELVCGSTDTNILCHDCAKLNKLCAYCGGDIDLKMRRKFELKLPE